MNRLLLILPLLLLLLPRQVAAQRKSVVSMAEVNGVLSYTLADGTSRTISTTVTSGGSTSSTAGKLDVATFNAFLQSGLSYCAVQPLMNAPHGTAIIHGLGTAHSLPTSTQFIVTFWPTGASQPDPNVKFVRVSTDAITIITPFDSSGTRETFTGLVLINSY